MAGDQIRRDFATLETRRGKTSEGPWFFAPSLRAALNASRKEDLMSRTNVRFALRLLLICSTAAVVPASAQHFEQIDSEGPQLSYVAAGRSEVWGLHFPGGEIYRLNPSTKKFLKVNGSLSQVAAGGGSLLEPDVVWGVNGAGVFSFSCTNASGKSCSYTPHNPPGSTYFFQIAVGEGDEDASAGGSDGCHPYEVWGLAASAPGSSGLPYRYNYCEGGFDQISLPLNSTTPFTHIATGGSDTWALDANAHIWHYNQYDNLWFQVTKGGYYGTLQQITVGVNDVWGLDGNGTVYRYDPNTATFVLIQSGSTVDVAQIAAGGDGVWAIAASSPGSGDCNVSRFQSYGQPTSAPPAGGGFQGFCLSSSQDATQVAVGSGAGIWVVNNAGQVNAWVRP
jgi:hypothetical protein